MPINTLSAVVLVSALAVGSQASAASPSALTRVDVCKNTNAQLGQAPAA